MNRGARRHPRCPRCGIVWHQIGNQTGHCSGDTRGCVDPAGIVTRSGEALYRPVVDTDGATVWRANRDRPTLHVGGAH